MFDEEHAIRTMETEILSNLYIIYNDLYIMTWKYVIVKM